MLSSHLYIFQFGRFNVRSFHRKYYKKKRLTNVKRFSCFMKHREENEDTRFDLKRTEKEWRGIGPYRNGEVSDRIVS